MRSFFHPPPPASSLTRFDRHCYNHLSYHRLTSLLLVLCLALGLVACQSGGSSASSANNDETISVNDGSDSSDINGDETPTLVDNSDIVFSSVDTSVGNNEDTKVGMREFLLTVTYNNLNTKQELNFIVGESTTPPTWNSVKANPTTITRDFNNGNLKTRRIYFSATEKLTDVSFDADGNASITGKVIDLSQAGIQSEADYTKAQAPGIMAPNTSYYVYVYDSRGALVKQQTVTTAGYPTDASSFTTPPQVGATARDSGTSSEEYFWGMDAWRDANGNYQIVNEVKKGEVFFLPLRMRSPVDWDLSIPNAYCLGMADSREISLRFTNLGGPISPLINFTPSGGIDTTNNLFSLANSPAIFTRLSLAIKEQDEIFDLMYLASGGVVYDVDADCTNIFGAPKIDFVSSFSFNLITE